MSCFSKILENDKEYQGLTKAISAYGNPVGAIGLPEINKVLTVHCVCESLNKKAFIIGAGNLGMALAKYDNFQNYGLNILALFDNDKSKIGKIVNNKMILDISKLPNLARKSDVDIAILTVPGRFAQATAEFLVKSNIKYIWNFTPVVLDVPENVQVWNENLMGNFLQFTYNI